MRVLLTGASGMVGRNILESPRAKNHEWLTPSRKELDLRDREAVKRHLSEKRPDFVVHAAGVVGGIQANLREPVRFFLDNLDMGRNVIMGAREAGVTKFLNLSCSCMYPRATALPMREESILTGELEPTNEGYALARVAAERLCEYISRENSAFQYKTLVSCNLYGRHDKFDPRHAHMVPAVIVKLHVAKLEGRKEIDIWGDGTALREFMYAGDLADCIFTALDRFESLPSVCNVGPGQDFSINTFYEKIAAVVGYKGVFVHDLSKPAGMARKVVDISKITSWGWKATTSLDEGLQLAYRFYLETSKGERQHEVSASL